MSPRKASLRVAHQRSCPNATKTALSSVGRGSGCACSPSYYVFSRDRDGRPVKGARVRDRQTAERALSVAQREIDEGRVGITKPKNITFSDWADEFGLPGHGPAVHPGRPGFGSTTEHVNIGPVKHIPVIP